MTGDASLEMRPLRLLLPSLAEAHRESWPA